MAWQPGSVHCSGVCSLRLPVWGGGLTRGPPSAGREACAASAPSSKEPAMQDTRSPFFKAEGFTEVGPKMWPKKVAFIFVRQRNKFESSCQDKEGLT